MNSESLNQIVQAVLYEGYVLYPYRASSVKNQRERFTFGRVYPQAYSAAQNGAEPSIMQTECLVESHSDQPRIEVSVRFLQPVWRKVGVLAAPMRDWAEGTEPKFEIVPELRVGETNYRTWQEAVEREVKVPVLKLRAGGRETCPFQFGASRTLEPIRDEQSRVVAVLLRQSEAIHGVVEISCHSLNITSGRQDRRHFGTSLDAVAQVSKPAVSPTSKSAGRRKMLHATKFTTRAGLETCATSQAPSHRVVTSSPTTTERGKNAELFKVSVCVTNLSPVPVGDVSEPDAIILRTFASTHTILRAQQAEFISLMDPPSPLKEAAAACSNIGTWPVLVGNEEKHERDTVLSSPIILYDYPKIAPESRGDLFDSSEIDEILTLRIMTMTDEEKREMRNVDAHARRLLERTEALPPQDLLKMHGAWRNASGAVVPPTAAGVSPAAVLAGETPGVAAGTAAPLPLGSFDEQLFGGNTRLEGVSWKDSFLTSGQRVRIRPKVRADVLDIVLAGRIGVIEAVEQDAEQRIHLALVLEDDPGKDLGLLRQPGHRFFYGLDEVEPLEAQP